jgi:hypothetical protein
LIEPAQPADAARAVEETSLRLEASLAAARPAAARTGGSGRPGAARGDRRVDTRPRSARRVLNGFNSGIYGEIDLSKWIAGNPLDVLATNFGQPASLFERFPHRDIFIASKDGT